MGDKSEFDKERTGTGTAEWAEVTENICRGCANACLYCYAAHNANRFKLRNRADWGKEELTKRAEMKSYPARDGVVMFPSSHDITPLNVEAYIRVAKLILEKGNKLLIVSKPRMVCISRLLEELGEYKDQILFRFTIGNLAKHITDFWEPGAPSPSERLACLAMAYDRGWSTSVSIEPMLAGRPSTISVVEAVRPFITDTIWIGKMNKPRLRVDMTVPENAKAVERVEAMQDDGEIIKLVLNYLGDPMVRWKDSIKVVVEKWQDQIKKQEVENGK